MPSPARKNTGPNCTMDLYQTMVEGLPYAVALLDQTGRFLEANQGCLEILGLTRGELLGKKLTEVWPQTSRPIITTAVRRALTGEATRCQTEWHRPDGGMTIWELFLNPLPGKDLKIVCVITDITIPAQADQLLRASEERYRTLVENINLGITLIGPDHRIIMTNRAHGEQFHKPVSEFIGKECFREFEKRTVVCPHCPGIRAMLTKQPAMAETIGIRDDGSTYSTRLHAFAVLDPTGKPAGFIEVSEDISEFKEAERALQEAEYFKQQIIDLTPNLVFIFAIDQRRIIYANPQIEQILGYQVAAITALDWEQIMKKIHPQDRQGFNRHYTRFLGEPGEQTLEIEYRIKHANGKWVWLHSRDKVFARSGSGAPQQVICTAVDVSHQKQVEAEIQKLNQSLEQRVWERTAQLATINRELEGFSYSIAHDLRTPLRGIDGFSQMILEQYQDRLDETGQDYLRRIRAASQRMALLIDALLNLARISRSELHFVTVNLSELADQIIASLRKAEPQRQVEWVVASELIVKGDPHLLQIMLDNFLGNAWKFTAQQARPRIEFGRLNDQEPPCFFIKDNGAGFEMDYADKLFIPFQRLHTVTEFPGSGIGLATVQRIIERHGGKVWAESQPGQGATFYFTL